MQDLLIIGAGPSGIYAGFQAGLRGVKATIVDSLPLQGGLLTTFYPDKPIYDIPGFANIRADHFIEELMKQYRPFAEQVPIYQAEKITKLNPIKDGYELVSETGKTFQSKFVMIASGAGSLSPRKLESVTNEISPYVHYSIQNLKHFEHKRVVVLGGGDSALDWANTLLPIAQSVTIIHRRQEFRALQYSLDVFKTKGQVLTPFEIQSIEKQKELRIHVKNIETQKSSTVIADEIVVCYGFLAAIGTYQAWGLDAKQEGIVVNSKMETNLPNVFAVGNASIYDGKSKNIATAFGEVAAVMEQINLRLFPGKKHVYSSFLKR
ncbi:MAG: NAD(P)/FAD-dependent oxidoreductase [Bacilli bacterium]